LFGVSLAKENRGGAFRDLVFVEGFAGGASPQQFPNLDFSYDIRSENFGVSLAMEHRGIAF